MHEGKKRANLKGAETVIIKINVEKLYKELLRKQSKKLGLSFTAYIKFLLLEREKEDEKIYDLLEKAWK